ncbi:MAG: HAMP domain-containing histidine kinase, partial [Proteobacteria bacterium]|nr:HAMP domain-containing histidine kinase [Pseudomonadota bacterium]
PPDIIYFAMRYKQGDDTLFVSRRLDRSTASKLVGRNAARSLQLLLLISLSIAVTLAAIIALLLKRVSRPVKALGQWARELDSERLNLPPPDFSYPELNEFAMLIRSSLSSVQESLEREHRFLRYTSHELRTPIAVIRNNIELIKKLESNPSQKWSSPQLQVINRIDRASLTMQHLTETLLWLNRDLAVPLKEQQVDLDEMIRHLVEEMRYLLNKKDVELELQTESCSLILPESPVRIVLGNLIRNAFQHTWQGRVTIFQHGNQVEITNDQSGEAIGSQDLGFGLGLQLTAEFTAKLGWAYEDENGADSYGVKVTFVSTAPEPGDDGGES